jgi:UDP-N-acetylglucosamine--N-acetylmuramyl-(pentapeptide) pyrophosphoryl-undecaprenol N-acetylglucosamine transferase
MLILMTGGGSLGSITPLLAIQNYLEKNYSDKNFEFFWIVSNHGPEIKYFESRGLRYKKIISAKLKRGFNLTLPWQLIKLFLACLDSFFYLIFHRPHLIISAGSYVSAPIVWAGWLLKIPSLIHQQDIQPGLANKMMAFCAQQITVCFPETKQYFDQQKTTVVGNPVRSEIKNITTTVGAGLAPAQAREYFKLRNNLPVVLIVSGSKGGIIINDVTIAALPKLLSFCQIIHITGHREIQSALSKLPITNYQLQSRYHQFEFLTDKMLDALLVADLIVSRAGINFLTEMAYLKKPSLLIPIFNSHQEANAEYFKSRGAAEILALKDKGADLTEQTNLFIAKIKELMDNQDRLATLSRNIAALVQPNSEEKISQIIFNLTK